MEGKVEEMGREWGGSEEGRKGRVCEKCEAYRAHKVASPLLIDWFTQPPMRRMRICFTDVFFVFPRFFPSATKYQTTVHGNG